jgi:membrane protein YdbS with pleckstrin-like domain
VLLFWGPVSVALGFGLSHVLAPGLAGGLAGAWFSLQLALALIWPALAFRFFGYAIRPDDLYVQRGVLFRRRTSIPHTRIQHVDTRQGPLEQIFGLSRVLVFTASGMAADGSLPGVDHALAESIRDDLSRRGGGDDGV